MRDAPAADFTAPPRGKGGGWAQRVQASKAVLGVRNPIREITDSIKARPNPDKKPISLAVGDPTAFGMRPHGSALEEMARVAATGAHNGYTHSCGLPACRDAVATIHSVDGFPVDQDDVFITAGCSQALQHAMASLARPGCNILLPRPGFPLYKTLCELYEIEARYYDLRSDRGWEMDTSQLAGLTDDNTIALMVCNPGNPTGHCYSRAHLEEMVGACEELCLPIIADEVYEDMAFGRGAFVPVAAVSERVPVIHVGALSKKWLVPGWRLGWAVLHDRGGVLQAGRIVEAMEKLSQVTLGPNSLVQAAAPAMLFHTPTEFYTSTMATIQGGARLCVERCQAVPGLECPSPPEGGMYILVRIVPGSLRGALGAGQSPRAQGAAPP